MFIFKINIKYIEMYKWVNVSSNSTCDYRWSICNTYGLKNILTRNLINVCYKMYRTIASLSPRGRSRYRIVHAVQNNQNIENIRLTNKDSWHAWWLFINTKYEHLGAKCYLKSINLEVIVNVVYRYFNT